MSLKNQTELFTTQNEFNLNEGMGKKLCAIKAAFIQVPIG